MYMRTSARGRCR